MKHSAYQIMVVLAIFSFSPLSFIQAKEAPSQQDVSQESVSFFCQLREIIKSERKSDFWGEIYVNNNTVFFMNENKEKKHTYAFITSKYIINNGKAVVYGKNEKGDLILETKVRDSKDFLVGNWRFSRNDRSDLKVKEGQLILVHHKTPYSCPDNINLALNNEGNDKSENISQSFGHKRATKTANRLTQSLDEIMNKKKERKKIITEIKSLVHSNQISLKNNQAKVSIKNGIMRVSHLNDQQEQISYTTSIDNDDMEGEAIILGKNSNTGEPIISSKLPDDISDDYYIQINGENIRSLSRYQIVSPEQANGDYNEIVIGKDGNISLPEREASMF